MPTPSTAHELHIRITHAPLSATFSTSDDKAQAVLRDDVKALALEHLERLQAPRMTPENWAEVTVEFLSAATVQYIKSLEGLLEELQADTDTPDETLARIEKVLR